MRVNPFPGLRPFRESEEHLFFGRERQIDTMIDKLARTRFLAVVGTSGSGKSSLVNCGLLPSLRRGLMAKAGTSWRVAVCRPGNNPVRALARALAQHGVLFDREAIAGLAPDQIVEATLRLSTIGLADITAQAQLGPGVNLLVVVDQFEELFRYRQVSASASLDEQTRSQNATVFVNLLLEAVAQPALPIYVVLTMRSDFLGDCAQFPWLPEAINEGQYLVPRMTRDERRAAIAGPVAVGGAEISPVLLTRLVNDVGDNPDQLSILQHALNRTWHEWEQAKAAEEPLALPDYEAIGTMAHALDRHAERAYAELGSDRQRWICERIFKALTDRGTDTRGIRRPTSCATLCALAEATHEEVAAVIEVFREPSRSFLMPPAPEPLEPDVVIDISHESLMRVWERLKTWSDEEARSARLYRRLLETAALHAAGTAGLWRDPELQLALDWRRKERPTVAWANQYLGGFDEAMAFLEKSETLREGERRENETRQMREREHEKTRALAEQQQLRLAMELKSARRLRMVASALAMMFVLTLLAGVWALGQRNEARAQAVLAEQQQEESVRQREIAEQQREIAEQQTRLAAQEREQAVQARQSLEDSLKALATAGGKKVRVALDEPHDEGVIRSLKAALPNRIYMQIVDARDREYAERMGQLLRGSDYIVLGVELVPQAIGLKRTEVRYYKMADAEVGNSIVNVLREAGDSAATGVYLKKEENNPNVRSKHFAVWFSSRAGSF